jgi:hypothetical protein
MTTVFDKTLVRADHFRSFRIETAPQAGWEASEREGHRIVDQQRYSDWHRVEHALHRFRQHIAELLAAGWKEA